MKTEPSSQKIVRGVAVFIVLGALTTVNDKYSSGGSFWVRVIVGALIAGVAVYLTVLGIDYLYRRRRS